MSFTLNLPSDFDTYATEVEAKGVFWDAFVYVDGRRVDVCFYDLDRLVDDMRAELAHQGVAVARRVLVLDRVIESAMRQAVASADALFFA